MIMAWDYDQPNIPKENFVYASRTFPSTPLNFLCLLELSRNLFAPLALSKQLQLFTMDSPVQHQQPSNGYLEGCFASLLVGQGFFLGHDR